MAIEESGNLKIVEETHPTTPTEQEPKKKRPGPCNPDQATKFVLQTTQSVNRFMSNMQHESDIIEEKYQVLIAEYHHSLCIIEDYFKQADRKLVLELIDDTTCKLLRTTTPKDAADKEKCPDPRVSAENFMTGHRALNRLAALPNFKDIKGADREEVCELLTHSRQPMPLLLMQPVPLLPWVTDYIHTNFSFCSNTQSALSSSYKYWLTSVILVNSDLKSNIYPTMNFTNNAVSTPYYQDPTIHL